MLAAESPPTDQVEETDADKELVEYLGGEVEDAAPDVSAPAPADGAPDAEAAGPLRDAQGRFVTPDAEVAPAPAAVAPPAAAPPGDVPPGVAPAPDKPFLYRAYNAEHPITGAVERADGVFFPSDAANALRQLLATGHGAQSRIDRQRADYEAQLSQAGRVGQEKVSRADAMLTRLATLRRDGKLAEFFDDLDRNWSTLEAQAEADSLKAQLASQQTEQAEAAEAAQAAQLEPVMREHLGATVSQFLATPEFAGLDRDAMVNRLWGSFFDRIFREAERDYPEYGIRKGDAVIDYDAVANELRYEAQLRRSVAPAAAPAAAATPPPAAPATQAKQTPPPVASAKGAASTKAKPKVPTFKTTKEVDAWFSSGGYAELDD